MKRCTKCLEIKSSNEFGLYNKTKDKLYPSCKLCVRAAKHTYRSTKEGRDKENLASKLSTRKMRLDPKRRAIAIKASCNWSKRNRDKMSAYKAKYKANQLNATPPWADFDKINTWYAIAQLESKEVDHIVPLQGKNVCGLHVHYNLQLLTKSENCSKGNKHAT